jgi:hypothetical protein
VRRGTWLAAVASVAAFAVALFLRMDQAYGPFNLSARPGDWEVLWELLRHQQIDGRVVREGVALGLVAALVPWLLLRFAAGRRGR